MYPQMSTNYKPTNAEEKLLDVMLDPNHRMKSITEICELANIDRTTYYTAFKKKDFVEYYNEISLSLVKQSVGPTINAVVREAKRGSFQHAKVILEMAGLYTEKKKVEVSGANKLEDLFPGKKDD